MVGNGCTNWAVDSGHAYVEMAFWHGLYDTHLYDEMNKYDCMPQFGRFNIDNITAPCIAAYTRFAELTSNINVYDVYGKCYDATTGCAPPSYNSDGKPRLQSAAETHRRAYTAQEYTPWLTQFKLQKEDESVKQPRELQSCTWDKPMEDYMNDLTVRDLLHIPQTANAWTGCTKKVVYTVGERGS